MNLCAAAATAKAAAAAAADVTHRWFVVGVVRYASTGWRQGPNKSGCPSVGTTTTRGAIQPAQTPQTNAGGRLYAAAWRPPKLACLNVYGVRPPVRGGGVGGGGGGVGGNQSLCWPAPRQSCFVFIVRAIVFVCASVAAPSFPPHLRAEEN